jgi:hypothetical protein
VSSVFKKTEGALPCPRQGAGEAGAMEPLPNPPHGEGEAGAMGVERNETFNVLIFVPGTGR